MNPLELKINKSAIFLLPVVLEKGIKFIDIISEDFENTYVADRNNPENDDKLIVKYKSHDEYDTYEWETDEAVNLYVFLAGHYSNFTENAKQKIMAFWEEDDESDLYKILYRESEEGSETKGRNGEILEAPDLQTEIYDILLIEY